MPSDSKPYILAVQPVDYSLTQGTDIPPPSPSLPSNSRPPTRPSGPLSSHPTLDAASSSMPSVPGAFPTDPEEAPAMSSESHRHTSESLRSPTSHGGVKDDLPISPLSRRPGSVRRLFSLSSLRQSFSSSRTSLSMPRASSSYANRADIYRPETPGAASVMSTTTTAAAGTPSMQPPASAMRSPGGQPGSSGSNKLRKKRGSNWFRRQSGLFAFEDGGRLDVVDEDRENKRFKQMEYMPVLPEIRTLGGGDLTGGSLEWDERVFK